MIAAIYALVLTTLALAVPYVADADCAWVLWPKNLDGDFVQNLLVYDTRQECERSQKDFIKGWVYRTRFLGHRARRGDDDPRARVG